MTHSLRSFCIVADDLSGAADCAAAFARFVGPVPVYLGEVGDKAESLAMDTDSRTMEAMQAAMVTTRAFEHIARSGPPGQIVYKKIDSTLRGHVGVELKAALQAAPQFAGVVIAPAFPEQGRILVGGQLRVQGRPSENLGHSGDLMGMLRMAGLPAALLDREMTRSGQLAPRIAQAIESGARAVVVDSVDPSELERLAEALCSPDAPRLLVVGSAGLARALAAQVKRNHAPQPAASAAAGPVMAVVGSFSRVSAAQLQAVQESGVAQMIRLSATQWLDPQHASLRQRALVTARGQLRDSRNVLITTDGELSQLSSRALVRAMARLTAPLLQLAGTCVLTGGDTARAMLNELGVNRLDVSGEFEPGISVGRSAEYPANLFVLKAGAFGDQPALQRIIRYFGPQPRPLP